jgi:hypothetical protein
VILRPWQWHCTIFKNKTAIRKKMETAPGSFLGVFGERSKLPPVKRVALFLRLKAVQQTTTPKGGGFVLPGTGETK